MLFTKIVVLATAGLVAANNAAPAITEAPEVRRDIGDDIETWAEDKANDAKTWAEGHASEAESWAKDKASDVKSWASEHASEAETWAKDKASHISTAIDAAETWVSTRVSSAVNEAATSTDDDDDDDDNDNDNAAVSLHGQAGAVAALVALGATAFGFIMA
ncbi:hypothetical protein CEP54_005147 [Fusarium duplospermum]|uniref:Uncharacterized protein n=1 Tax=Fusarium duplospermum TaxID=1325734 RepID=A0A428QEG9_9HYPO|nr:hypothetical protein CEP54_005147 [Fusarium duplospermum]